MIKEIENFKGVKELHHYRTLTFRFCCLTCGNADEYGEQLVCTLYYEPVDCNGFCDKWEGKK